MKSTPAVNLHNLSHSRSNTSHKISRGADDTRIVWIIGKNQLDYNVWCIQLPNHRNYFRNGKLTLQNSLHFWLFTLPITFKETNSTWWPNCTRFHFKNMWSQLTILIIEPWELSGQFRNWCPREANLCTSRRMGSKPYWECFCTIFQNHVFVGK